MTAPADPSGTQPKTTLGYVSNYAWVKSSATGPLIPVATPVSKLSTAKTCLSGATCAGTANEQITTMTYQTGSSSVVSNNLPISVNVKDGVTSTTVTSTTAMAYDNVGNLLSVDGPLSGTGDTTVYKYDALRRQTGVIGPDPDGSGTGNPNAATKVTYDTKGRVSVVEQGSSAGQSDANFASFSANTKVERTFDSGDRRAHREADERRSTMRGPDAVQL